MSGHSKWANIKNRKAAQDKKKTAVFTRIMRDLISAAKINPDPKSPRLATVIQKAREANMPGHNIESAIKRAQGIGAEGRLESAMYAGMGPLGTAFLIEAQTANKNKTVAELRHILENYGANMSETSSVLWQFSQKGVIELELNSPLTEEQELKIIEAGAEDIKGNLVLTEHKDLAPTAKKIAEAGFKVNESYEGWVANEKKLLEAEALEAAQELFTELEGHEDVTRVYVNF